MTPTHRITTTAVVVLSLAAAGASTATARPDFAPAAKVAAPTLYTDSAPPPVVRIQTPPSGFDWGDAGIGAAGGVALTMLGLGGALALSQRGPRRTRHSTAQPS
jgi:hypothetical protein